MKLKVLLLLICTALTACNGFGGTPVLPTTVQDSNNAAPQTSPQGMGSGVIASGVVAPAQEAHIAAALAGKVEMVNVAVGEQVEAGQVLVKLAGSEKLIAAVEAANLELLNAQQALQNLQDSAALVAAQTQAEVTAAKKALADAQRKLRNLTRPDVAYYQDQYAQAQERLLQAQQNLEKTNIGDFVKAVQSAQDTLKQKTDQLNDVLYIKQNTCPTCDRVFAASVGRFINLEDAQQEYDDAVNALRTAEINLEQAQANNNQVVKDAQEKLDDASANLKAAQSGPKALDVEIAEASVALAEATLQDAETRYAKVKSGPDLDKLTAAQARLTSAQATLAAAKSALADLELRAPFSGTVAVLHIHVSEWVAPGQPVLVLSDLQHLRVETTDLSERDIPKIAIGQSVMVRILALDQEVPGRVSEISPLADTLGGDVVYQTTIELDTTPTGLRVGMSVEVQFGTEE